MAKGNYWLKSGIISTLQNVFSVVLGFSILFILLRVLKNKEEYGTWVLFSTVATLIEVARNGFTQEALIKYLTSADKNERGKINTAVFCINMACTLVIVVVLFFLGPWFEKIWDAPEMAHIFQIYSIVFFFTSILNHLNCIEQANLNFTGVFLSNTTRQVIFLSYILYCYFTSGATNVIHLAYLQVVCAIVALIIAFFYTRKKIEYAYSISKKWVTDILHFGKYTFGISLGSMIAGSIDQMMLGSLLSKSASAVFNIAMRITAVVDIPANAMGTIVYPQSSARIESEGIGSVKYLYEKSVGVILAILVPSIIGFYLFSGFIIDFLGDGKYSDAVPLVRLTILLCIFTPFGRQTGIALTSAGKTKLNFLLLICSVTIIITFNIIFIKFFGLMGAVYASGLASIVSFIISKHFLKKYFNINPFNAFIYAIKFYPEFTKKYLFKK